jgi:arsenate reductase
LELLRIRGNQLDVIEYLQHPPSPDVLKDLVQKLDVHPRELIRAKERQAAGLPPTEDEDEIIEQIVQNPSIMQRPIVVAGERACVARPPERLLEILRRQ